ncbi:Hypothetical protein GLP15_4531 [Giardia lamblia P15]|uniref:Uncharacterized protein n=1 Tax=Giardia intestinalis (strain P15) TaxID=658858 RepID=E1F3D9_GIAIA|nr:Hypothetical protein GLP15_4531 [Giardia lamblia P15]
MNLKYFILPETTTVAMHTSIFVTLHGVHHWTVACEDSRDTLPLAFNFITNWLRTNPQDTLILVSSMPMEYICRTSSFLFFQDNDIFAELRTRFSIFYLDSYESFASKFSKQWKRPIQCLVLYDPVRLTHEYLASHQKMLLGTILAVSASKVLFSAAFGGPELLYMRPNAVLLRRRLKPHGVSILQIHHTTEMDLYDNKGALLVRSPRGLLTCHAIVLQLDRYLAILKFKR